MPKLQFVAGRLAALRKKAAPKRKPAPKKAAPKKKTSAAAKYNKLVLSFYKNGAKFAKTGNSSVYNKYSLENMLYAMYLTNGGAQSSYNRHNNGQWYSYNNNSLLTKNYLIKNLGLTYPIISPATRLKNYKKDPLLYITATKRSFPNRFK